MFGNGKHAGVTRKNGLTMVVDEYHKIHWVFIISKRWFAKSCSLDAA
jgi:hypothetical protein